MMLYKTMAARRSFIGTLRAVAGKLEFGLNAPARITTDSMTSFHGSRVEIRCVAPAGLADTAIEAIWTALSRGRVHIDTVPWATLVFGVKVEMIGAGRASIRMAAGAPDTGIGWHRGPVGWGHRLRMTEYAIPASAEMQVSFIPDPERPVLFAGELPPVVFDIDLVGFTFMALGTVGWSAPVSGALDPLPRAPLGPDGVDVAAWPDFDATHPAVLPGPPVIVPGQLAPIGMNGFLPNQTVPPVSFPAPAWSGVSADEGRSELRVPPAWAATAMKNLVEWFHQISVTSVGADVGNLSNPTTRAVLDLRHPLAWDVAEAVGGGAWAPSLRTMGVFAKYVPADWYVPAVIGVFASAIGSVAELERFLAALSERDDPFLSLEACSVFADFGIPGGADPFAHVAAYRAANEAWYDVFAPYVLKGLATPPGPPGMDPIDMCYLHAWVALRDLPAAEAADAWRLFFLLGNAEEPYEVAAERIAAFKAEHGAGWYREMIRHTCRNDLAIAAVLREYPTWAAMAFAEEGVTPEKIFAFRGWRLVRAVLSRSPMEWTSHHSCLAARHLVEYWGPRATAIVDAQAQWHDPSRGPLVHQTGLNANNLPESAREWVWRHRKSKRWYEVLAVALASAKLDFGDAESLDERLEKIGTTDMGVFDRFNLPPVDRARWSMSVQLPERTWLPEIAAAVHEFRSRWLPRSDARGVMLGNYTRCCQCINGAAKSVAWHGQENPNGAFVVWELDELDFGAPRIAAQAWVWRNEDLVCFDSVEVADGYTEGSPRQRLLDAVVDTALRCMVAGYRVHLGSGLTFGYAAERVPAPAPGSDAFAQYSPVPNSIRGEEAVTVAQQMLALPVEQRLAGLESLDTQLTFRVPLQAVPALAHPAPQEG